jgi:hypothetical protein
MPKKSPEASHLHEELVVKENSAPNPKVTNNTVESPDLESFTKKLGLDFVKNDDDLRKFYGIYNKSVPA